MIWAHIVGSSGPSSSVVHIGTLFPRLVHTHILYSSCTHSVLHPFVPLPSVSTFSPSHIDSEKEQLVILDEEIHHTQALLAKLRLQYAHRSTQLEPYQMCIATFPERFCPKSSFGLSQNVGLPFQRETRTHRGKSSAFGPCARQLALSIPKLWARVNLDLTGQCGKVDMNRVAKAVIDASQNYPCCTR